MAFGEVAIAYRPSVVRIVAVFIVAACSAGCESGGDPTSGVVATWEIRPDPPDTGLATVEVSLRDSSGAPVRGADVVIEGIMTHPGMAPETANAREIGPGRYAAEMRFTMRGDWVLLLEANLPDSRTLVLQKELPGVGSR